MVLVLPLCIEVYPSSLTEKDSMSIILILLFGGIEMWGRKQMEQELQNKVLFENNGHLKSGQTIKKKKRTAFIMKCLKIKH